MLYSFVNSYMEDRINAGQQQPDGPGPEHCFLNPPAIGIVKILNLVTKT